MITVANISTALSIREMSVGLFESCMDTLFKIVSNDELFQILAMHISTNAKLKGSMFVYTPNQDNTHDKVFQTSEESYRAIKLSMMNISMAEYPIIHNGQRIPIGSIITKESLILRMKQKSIYDVLYEITRIFLIRSGLNVSSLSRQVLMAHLESSFHWMAEPLQEVAKSSHPMRFHDETWIIVVMLLELLNVEIDYTALMTSV